MKKIPFAVLLALSTLASTHAADYESPGSFKRGSERPWAYSPLKPIAPPAVKDKAWGRAPIDAVVLAKLEGRGGAPSRAAERAVCMRRARREAPAATLEWPERQVPEVAAVLRRSRALLRAPKPRATRR